MRISRAAPHGRLSLDCGELMRLVATPLAGRQAPPRARLNLDSHLPLMQVYAIPHRSRRAVMLLHVPAALNQSQVMDCLRALAQAAWFDGRRSATVPLANIKHNRDIAR